VIEFWVENRVMIEAAAMKVIREHEQALRIETGIRANCPSGTGPI
jgi:hypothetical protein